MNDLITTRQLMDLLRVDRTTIYRMLNDGRLPAVRVGGQWRFSRQAIDAWLAEQNGGEPKLGIQDAPPETSLDSNILPISCLQPIQEIFAQTSHIGAITTDLNGKPILTMSNPCAFCSLVLATESGRAQCEASWRKLAHQTDRRPRLEKCHAGLIYARGRVVVHNIFVAMFFVGQFVVDNFAEVNTRAHLAQVARSCAVTEKQLAQAAKKIYRLDKSNAERLPHLIELVAAAYSQIGEERLSLMSRLKQVAEIAAIPNSS